MSGGQIMVILIILIVSVTGILKARYNAMNGGKRVSRRSRGQRLDGEFTEEQHTPRELELESEVTALRKRLEVLERITTDANSSERQRSQQVAAEIESLRDR